MDRTIRGIEEVRCRWASGMGRTECSLDLIDAPRYDHDGGREAVFPDEVKLEGGFDIPIAHISEGSGFSNLTWSVFRPEDRDTDIDCSIDDGLMSCKTRRS